MAISSVKTIRSIKGNTGLNARSTITYSTGQVQRAGSSFDRNTNPQVQSSLAEINRALQTGDVSKLTPEQLQEAQTAARQSSDSIQAQINEYISTAESFRYSGSTRLADQYLAAANDLKTQQANLQSIQSYRTPTATVTPAPVITQSISQTTPVNQVQPTFGVSTLKNTATPLMSLATQNNLITSNKPKTGADILINKLRNAQATPVSTGQIFSGFTNTATKDLYNLATLIPRTAAKQEAKEATAEKNTLLKIQKEVNRPVKAAKREYQAEIIGSINIIQTERARLEKEIATGQITVEAANKELNRITKFQTAYIESSDKAGKLNIAIQNQETKINELNTPNKTYFDISPLQSKVAQAKREALFGKKDAFQKGTPIETAANYALITKEAIVGGFSLPKVAGESGLKTGETFGSAISSALPQNKILRGVAIAGFIIPGFGIAATKAATDIGSGLLQGVALAPEKTIGALIVTEAGIRGATGIIKGLGGLESARFAEIKTTKPGAIFTEEAAFKSGDQGFTIRRTKTAGESVLVDKTIVDIAGRMDELIKTTPELGTSKGIAKGTIEIKTKRTGSTFDINAESVFKTQGDITSGISVGQLTERGTRTKPRGFIQESTTIQSDITPDVTGTQSITREGISTPTGRGTISRSLNQNFFTNAFEMPGGITKTVSEGKTVFDIKTVDAVFSQDVGIQGLRPQRATALLPERLTQRVGAEDVITKRTPEFFLDVIELPKTIDPFAPKEFFTTRQVRPLQREAFSNRIQNKLGLVPEGTLVKAEMVKGPLPKNLVGRYTQRAAPDIGFIKLRENTLSINKPILRETVLRHELIHGLQSKEGSGLTFKTTPELGRAIKENPLTAIKTLPKLFKTKQFTEFEAYLRQTDTSLKIKEGPGVVRLYRETPEKILGKGGIEADITKPKLTAIEKIAAREGRIQSNTFLEDVTRRVNKDVLIREGRNNPLAPYAEYKPKEIINIKGRDLGIGINKGALELMRFREEALTQLRERATRIPNEPRMPSGLGDLSFDYGTQFTDETIRTGKNAPTGRFEFRGVDISPEIRRVAMEEQFKTGFETGITGSITPRAGISFSAGKIFSIRPISQNKQFSAMKIKPFTTTAVNQIVSPIQLTKQDSVVIQTPVPIQTQIPTQRTTNITNNFGNPGFGGIPGLGGPTGGIRPPPLLPTAFFAPSVGVGSGRSGSSRGGRRRGTRVTQTLVGFSLGLKSPLSGGKGRIFSGLELTR